MKADQTLTLAFTAIPVQRPREQVVDQIKQAVLEGLIREGDRLPSENALAQSFNVSRATVREALRSLIESGLLMRGNGTTSGLYVQNVDHKSFSRAVAERLANILDLGSVTAEEVSVFRDLLEVPVARLAAEHRTAKNLEALSDIIDEESSTTYDNPSVPDLNARFHSEIAAASGNRVIAAFVSAIHKTAHPLAFINMDAGMGRTAVSHHIDLYRAVESRDPGRAAEVMRAHLEFLNTHANSETSGPFATTG